MWINLGIFQTVEKNEEEKQEADWKWEKRTRLFYLCEWCKCRETETEDIISARRENGESRATHRTTEAENCRGYTYFAFSSWLTTKECNFSCTCTSNLNRFFAKEIAYNFIKGKRNDVYVYVWGDLMILFSFSFVFGFVLWSFEKRFKAYDIVIIFLILGDGCIHQIFNIGNIPVHVILK